MGTILGFLYLHFFIKNWSLKHINFFYTWDSTSYLTLAGEQGATDFGQVESNLRISNPLPEGGVSLFLPIALRGITKGRDSCGVSFLGLTTLR